MNTTIVIQHISQWLKEYAEKSGMDGFAVGISGGIDSAVTSWLCANTGLEVWAIHMPIYQESDQVQRAIDHLHSLEQSFDNVTIHDLDMTPMFASIYQGLPEDVQKNDLAMANTRSRLRMLALYAFAGAKRLLVAGTGNKIEDFGVGFFTKYGDGGVDLSPIGDLTKSQVYEIARAVGISQDIIQAAPTDGLWEESLTDEQRMGASYPELEWAMEFETLPEEKQNTLSLTPRQEEVLAIYRRLHKSTLHKITPIPVCKIPAVMKSHTMKKEKPNA